MLSLDFTDRQIKIVRGSLSGSKVRVIQVETLQLPAGLIENGFIVDVPMLASELLEFIQSKDIKEKDIIAGIGSGLILNKELVLPRPKKLNNSFVIETMIQNNMNITSDYSISFRIVGELEDENKNAMIRVMATAVPQRLVDGYSRLFSHLGLSLKSLYVSSNCISRLVENSQKLQSLMPLMMVQVEEGFVNINLYDDGRLLLSRRVSIDSEGGREDSDVLVQTVYENVFRMIQFIGGRPGAKPLKEIVFYGYIPDFVMLTSAMSSFNTPIQVLTAPGNIVSFCEFDFAEYANAVSAFFKPKHDYDRVDLLKSSSAKEKKQTSSFGFVLILSLLGAIVIVAGAYFVISSINSGLQSRISVVESEINSAELQERVNTLNTKISRLSDISLYSDNIEIAKLLFDFQPKIITEVLEKLEENMPDGMSINGSVSYNGYNISVSFTCTDDSMPSAYVQALNEQGYFENINYSGYSGSGDDGNKTYSFSLSMLLKGGNAYEVE